MSQSLDSVEDSPESDSLDPVPEPEPSASCWCGASWGWRWSEGLAILDCPWRVRLFATGSVFWRCCVYEPPFSNDCIWRLAAGALPVAKGHYP